VRRGQTVLTLVVVLAAVILVWSFLAPVMNDQIQMAQGLTPMEAFFLNNMNLAIGVAILFFAVAGWRRMTAV
jgi:uncharacterized membrane protein